MKTRLTLLLVVLFAIGLTLACAGGVDDVDDASVDVNDDGANDDVNDDIDDDVDDDVDDDADDDEWSEEVTGEADISDNTNILPDDQVAQAEIIENAVIFPKEGNEELLAIEEGDVIVSGYENGFLRKVTSISETGESITFQTIEASLVDAFDSMDVVMEIPLESAKGLVDVVFDGMVLFDGTVEGSSLRVEITHGEFHFNPVLKAEIVISGNSLERFYFEIDSDLSAILDATATSTAEFTVYGLEVSIPIATSPYVVILIGGFPVVIRASLDLVSGFEASFNASLEVSGGASVESPIKAGVLYENGSWYLIEETNFQFTPFGPEFSGNVTSEFESYCDFSLNVNFYELAGPFVKIGPKTTIRKYLIPWCQWEVLAGVDGSIGIESTFLGPIPNIEFTLFDTEHVLLASDPCDNDDDVDDDVNDDVDDDIDDDVNDDVDDDINDDADDDVDDDADDDAWTIEIVDSNNTGSLNSIALDSADNAHISYCDAGNGDLKYATNASGSWVLTTVDSGRHVGAHTSIALDSADHVHISYWGNNDLKYTTNITGLWVLTTVDSEGLWTGYCTSIALDSADRVHISYYDVINDDLKYATNRP